MKTLKDIPLSILELAPMRLGEGAGDTLSRMLDAARHAEQCGINRYWLAEHHNMQGIASSATSVLIGAVAACTERMRVGSGGIMLPNHPPLVIAEQFGTLDALYPGRIDLGLGRAPGTDPLTSRALRRDDMRAEHYREEVESLQRFLGPADPVTRVRAVPGEDSNVAIWLLGSSLYSAQLAAEKGLPYAFAGHFAPRHAYEAVSLYKERFQPSDALEKPYVMLGVPLIAAETDEEAHYLATSSQQRILSLMRGEPLWLRPPVQSMEGLWTEQERASVEAFLGLSIIGGPVTIKSKLEHLIREFEVDELMFTNDLYDQEQRKRALSILASCRS